MARRGREANIVSGVIRGDAFDDGCDSSIVHYKEGSVDCVITDPPYGEHTHNAGRRGCTGYKEPTRPGATRAQFNRKRDLGFAHLTKQQRRFASIHFSRITRRWVLVFTDIEGIHGWKKDLERAGLQYVRTCLWKKLRATPQFTGDRPANWAEAIVVAHQTHPDGSPMKKQWNGGGKGNIYEHPVVQNLRNQKLRHHTTQKPAGLCNDLIRDFTNPGELIADPFAGVASIGIAAKRMGRRYLGWEIDEKYAKIGNKLLSQAPEGDLLLAEQS